MNCIVVEPNTTEYTNCFKSLYRQYYQLFPDEKKIDIHIIVTDDINKTYISLCPEYTRQLSFQKNSDNGRMVPPEERDMPMYILISKYLYDSINNGVYDVLGTFAHELTHGIDYYLMAKEEGLFEFNKIQTSRFYVPFCLWSEYHARNHGYLFLRWLTSEKDENHAKLIKSDAYIEKEFNYYTEQVKRLICNKSSSKIILYEMMQLLGRMVYWSKLYPDKYNSILLQKQFPMVKHIGELYELLKETSAFVLYYEKMEKVRSLIEVISDVLYENGRC